MNTRPESIILQERHEQSGGGWEVVAVYGNKDENDDEERQEETLATFSPFLNQKLVQQIASLIAQSQGLNGFEQEHE